MISGFIYEWFDCKTTLKYIGKHEGLPTDNYIGSGTMFKKKYNKRPNDFSRTILWESNNTTVEELSAKELEFLEKISEDELYWGNNRKYYNQLKSSTGYTSLNNPMNLRINVERMMNTQKENGSRKPINELGIKKYGVDGWHNIRSSAAMNNKNGSGNLGKLKSEDHKRHLSEALIGKSRGGECGGRHCITPEVISLVDKYGFLGAAKFLDIHIEALKGRYYRAKRKLT